MKTPSFFYKKSVIPLFLTPLSFLFLLITKLRNLFIKPQKLSDKFVICLGNATVGGAGKTPSAIFLANLLKGAGLDVCFLSRGYGRKSKGFMRIYKEMSVDETGDEPRLLLEFAPVYLFSGYDEVLRHQSQIKEEVVIMDDGFQNPSIIKDFSILVVDGRLKFGNGLLLPAGPLRERVSTAISRSNAVFNIGGEHFCKEKPEFILSRDFELKDGWNGGYLAFSGLAVNQKFFSSLEGLGLDVRLKLEFRDHHPYLRSELEEILKKADELGLKSITTEKDFAKIPDDLKPRFSVLKMALLLEDKAFLLDLIKKT